MDQFDHATELERLDREWALSRAGVRQTARPSREDCAECGKPIPEARRRAVPGVQLCVACQTETEAT
jgi:phage/conjugal plasmid C-4 type zinc finger TraR family protein